MSASRNPLIERLIRMAPPTEQPTVLDVGFGQGGDALHLASEGYNVLGISNDPAEVERANEAARQRRLSNCHFVELDVRDLAAFLRAERGGAAMHFGIVIASNILHRLPKVESRKALVDIKNATRFAGYNAIRGYMLDDTVTDSANRANMLQPDELVNAYHDDPTWQIRYRKSVEQPARIIAGREHVSSYDSVIAQHLRQRQINRATGGWE